MYKFLYAYKNNSKSKQFIVSKFNYDDNLSIDRIIYHKKDLMMSETFYKSLFYKIRDLYNNYNLIAYL